ncbi:hypothetical protein ACFWNT_41265, partial [Streptomyces sp. NPDC058409]|uniref:hypothetical protein n=1 Tax=Streptomyces sp. NPDC058409 TaxID=3346484 RepID=UPI003661E151
MPTAASTARTARAGRRRHGVQGSIVLDGRGGGKGQRRSVRARMWARDARSSRPSRAHLSRAGRAPP